MELLAHKLRDGCDELSLPKEAAVELLRFLQTARWYDVIRSEDDFRSKDYPSMSPSERLDKLWHWMLLNTKVADKVHAVIGGSVHHSTMGARDSDSDKVLRQCFAMTAMARLGGWKPRLDLWREPGTLMAHVWERPDGAYEVPSLPRDYPVACLQVLTIPEDGRERLTKRSKKSSTTNTSYRVTVKTISGKIYNFDDVPADLTVLGLKKKIETAEGSPVNFIMLIYDGKQLDDDMCLCDCGFTSQAVELVMVFKMRGC